MGVISLVYVPRKDSQKFAVKHYLNKIIQILFKIIIRMLKTYSLIEGDFFMGWFAVCVEFIGSTTAAYVRTSVKLK